MRIKLFAAAIFLSCAASCFAQGVYVNGIALKTVNGYTTPISNATITVCAANTGGIPCSPALVGDTFVDSGLTIPLSNPFTSDAQGNYSFAIAPGNYTITVTAAGFAGKSYQATAGGSGSGGNGTVNPGTTCNASYYPSSAATVSPSVNLCFTTGVSTFTGTVLVTGGGTNYGFELAGNTGTCTPYATTDYFGFCAPDSTSFTSYLLQLPTTGPSSADPVLSCGSPSGNVSPCSYIPVCTPTNGLCGANQGGTSAPDYLGNWENTPSVLSPGTAGSLTTSTANQVAYILFRLTDTFTFDTLTLTTSNVAGGGASVGIGVFSSTCNRLVHYDNIQVLNSNTIYTATPTGGSVTLNPGYYYWAWSASISGTITTSQGLSAYTPTNPPWNARSVIRTGTGSNAMSSGVLPATCGTLSSGYPTSNSLPMWIIEPN